MPYDETLAGRIRELLDRRRGVLEKKMFGGVVFLLHGNMLVGVWKDSLIARIGPDAYESALNMSHVREFDITGRPMKGWVMIEPEGLETDEELKQWIETTSEFVETLPIKK